MEVDSQVFFEQFLGWAGVIVASSVSTARKTRVHLLALLFTDDVNLGKLRNLEKPQVSSSASRYNK